MAQPAAHPVSGAIDGSVGEQEGFEAAVAELTGSVAELMGVTNACYGRLVELVGVALDGELWNGWGIHSASHWLAWQTGLSPTRAAGVVRIAERRAELPCAIAALAAGELCVDAVEAIAKGAPATYEASITEFAKAATLQQLRKCLRGYTYDPETEAARAKSKPAEDERSVSTGTDDLGWWMTARLPADEGAVVDQALAAARDQLWDQERAATPEGERPATVSFADALVGTAESFLRAGEAAHPGSDRYQVLLHLEAAPDRAAGGNLSVHQGPVLPTTLRRLLTCSCELTPVWERHGTPLSVGRAQRVPSRKLRRLIEHRDGGCRIPGCGRTRGTEIHHIEHWEDGGGTDTANLVCLCRAHHRQHHLGVLAITGNADAPVGEPGAFEVRDRWDHVLDPSGTPIRPRPGHTPEQAARAVGIEPGTYVHPLGERLDPWAVTFNPNDPAAAPPPLLPPELDPEPEPDRQRGDHDEDDERPHGASGGTEPDEPWPGDFDPEALAGADPPAALVAARS